MADGAGKLDKLSRLKSLKSGLRARGGAAGREDAPSLDAMFGEDGGRDVPAPAPAPDEPGSGSATPVAPPAGDDDAESLSAYFEALGIVPDGAKASGATGRAPEPYAPPSKAYTRPAETPGRDVDVRDRWADPVREDDTYLSSFAGDPSAKAEVEEVAPVVEESAAPAPAEETPAAAFDGPAPVSEGPAVDADDAPAETADAPEEADAVPAPSGMARPDETAGDVPDAAMVDEGSDDPSPGLPDDLPEDDDDAPDFDRSIDIEAFEREIAMADSTRADDTTETGPEANADADVDNPGEPLSIVFDSGRAAMLEQVSKQMGCSIDDVVVTAIDWYLDALMADDGADAQSAES